MKIGLEELIEEFSNNLKLDYDLKKKNWFNIGGKTKAFFKADSLQELIRFLKKIQNQEKIFVLGAGSNTLITDKKFNGVVIKLSKNFNNSVFFIKATNLLNETYQRPHGYNQENRIIKFGMKY